MTIINPLIRNSSISAKRLSIRFLLLIALGLSPLRVAWAQTEANAWNILAKISYQTKMVEGFEMDVPQFSKEVSALNGKKIRLKGFCIVLPEMKDKGFVVLSRYPFSDCYFCGAAGQETVIELYFEKSFEPQMDRLIEVEGILELNGSDINHLMYKLKKVRLL